QDVVEFVSDAGGKGTNAAHSLSLKQLLSQRIRISILRRHVFADHEASWVIGNSHKPNAAGTVQAPSLGEAAVASRPAGLHCPARVGFSREVPTNGIGRAERCSSSEVLAIQPIKLSRVGDGHRVRRTR